MAAPTISPSSEQDEPQQQYTGMATPQGSLEMVQCNVAGCHEQLPRQDLPVHLANHLSRMSEEFARLRQDIEKKLDIKDLEQELERREDEENMQLASATEGSSTEQAQPMATREEMIEQVQQTVRKQVGEEVAKQMATQQELARVRPQEEVAEQVQQMATQEDLAQARQQLQNLIAERQKQQNVWMLGGALTIGGIIVVIAAMVFAAFFMSPVPSSDFHQLSVVQVKQENMWSILTRVLPLKISLKEFGKHHNSKTLWESDPFYTHFRGYKMFLRVCANGCADGTGTHVSVGVVLMRGEFDSELSWPFGGTIQIGLLNVSGQLNNLVSINCSEAPGIVNKRVTSGDNAQEGWGSVKFVHHKQLPQFLNNDAIVFQLATRELSDYVMPTDLAQQFIAITRSTQTMWSMLTNTLPLNFTMEKFRHHQTSEKRWYSEPFYTHFHGYKMCVCVVANGYGDGAGTHVSVFFYLMRGEFDDKLSWPFQGSMRIALLSVSGQLQKIVHTIDFKGVTGDVDQRVFSEERAPIGRGTSKYASHVELEPYLDEREDSITFQVALMEMPNDMHGPLSVSRHTSMWSMLMSILPLNITMNNFTAYKNSGEPWFSKPFYTHIRSYKMCVEVLANGNAVGAGTHVSVFVHLMRGEFDDQLSWPYQGTIQISILSLTGELQKLHNIGFKEATDGNNKRVLSGERGLGWGHAAYVSHVELESYLDNHKDSITLQLAILENSDDRYGPLFLSQHTTMWSMLTNTLPLNISMKNFSKYKTLRISWYSEPFYTHFHGYKMCLNVDANGYGAGAGTHVSVYLNLMRSEFDDKLSWPFQGSMRIALLSVSGQLQKIHTIDYKRATGVHQRVFSEERAPFGQGLARYASHVELEPYLDEREDSITFQVALMEMPNDMHGPLSVSQHTSMWSMLTNILPLNITMNNFTAYKNSGEPWFSEPFYTHIRGYKMCLEVLANGAAYGDGTHVSVFVYLMRGEFDDKLSWPFQSTIHISILSVNGEFQKPHHVVFDISSRVVYEERAKSGNGPPKYVAHNELELYLDKGKDSITFRVVSPENLLDSLYGILLRSQHNRMWSMLTNILPLNITMTNFTAYKALDVPWYSDPFYTHFQGYKMCLRVDAKGTHVSVSVSLMRGEFDDKLIWPFRGTIQIGLLNLSGELQKLHDIDFDTKLGAERVLSREIAYIALGPQDFVTNDKLESYLDQGNDSITFQVVHVKLQGAILSPLSLSQHMYSSLWSMHTNILPLNIIMGSFTAYKTSQLTWYSEPFYTHFQGYKMCLRVDADGYGSGASTHVSVFIQLMRGEFDDMLTWPFHGTLHIKLLNLNGESQNLHIAVFEDGCGGASARVVSGEVARSGSGTHKYVAHNELDSFINKDKDSITFQVTLVQIRDDMHGPLSLSQYNNMWYLLTNILPLNISMTKFSVYKASDSFWHSDPFYTHFQGFKMQLNVDANGYRAGAGTHVSVFVYLMRGEFDDKLSWPFRGTIQIKLLSLNGKFQKSHNIIFDGKKGTSSRVVSGERAKHGTGDAKYIAHNELELYLNKNKDSITFQVALVELRDHMYGPLSLLQHSSVWSVHTHIPPLNISMPRFSLYKDSDSQWYSDPFYTHFHGYKMRLTVVANGHDTGIGTHISVYIHLMRGEFDDKLRWPIESTVIQIGLLDLSGELRNVQSLVAGGMECKRVFTEETATVGFGFAKYIAHSELELYLDKDKDSITFHVTIKGQNHVDGSPSLSGGFQSTTMTMWTMLVNALPVNATMENFTLYRKIGWEWHSEPFYTHLQGYKMCLNVDANGYGVGAGTHISVYIYLMRGEFDDKLNWPFRGTLQIKLLSLNGELQKLRHIIFDGDEVSSSQVVSGERANRGSGNPKYLSHNDLESYLDKDKDSIMFQVALVELPDRMYGPISPLQHTSMWSMLTNTLPLNISMTKFSEYKASSSPWYSEPFYTHFQGYKMCLNVDANGYGVGAGTHISVYIYLVCGEFDDKLNWPFRGAIQVKLLSLNGKVQKLHHIVFDGDKISSSRVVSGEQAIHATGAPMYLAHSELELYLDKDKDSFTFQVALVQLN